MFTPLPIVAAKKLGFFRKKKPPIPKFQENNRERMKIFSQAAYLKDKQKIEHLIHKYKNYKLDTQLSSSETKVFVNKRNKKVVIAFRGTKLTDGARGAKDVVSDLAIMTGMEKYDKRFKQALKAFDRVRSKYPGYRIDTTGHSLGGQLATYVTRERSDDVTKNISFSRGTGFLEPFRERPKQTTDISHENDIISLGARLSSGKKGSSVVDDRANLLPLDAHNLGKLNVV
mmetsp:Transcript_8711/g.11476  ORF Transcript_8711/g.11476 Transcript_8711/m.11476 type:complete len:229 (+) Transcript_8711:908-1594(+)|eukprot:CAMPEP_0117741200 /NCGR_PEP_ID=MMETSP0947-20121206/4773_1 /TAXON_ID=44440 /ORGANISM="Chattonella subsalsa, Strain CCMP2191" /LENGTH=228 /DNA_ID=CAMNT_0005557415 /DNA_START=484 /DNA_END=1170 /DNA_ORIENTATION=+